MSGKQILSSARLYRWINSSQCCSALQGEDAEQNYLHNIQDITPLDSFHQGKKIKSNTELTQNVSDAQMPCSWGEIINLLPIKSFMSSTQESFVA